VKNRSIMLIQLLCGVGLIGLWGLSATDLLTGEPQHTLWRFFGRFHPVVLHLPIGLIVLLVGLEGLALRNKASKGAELVPLVLGLTIVVTLLTVGTGTLLAYGEGADEPLVREHMRNGIWLAMCTLMLGVLRPRPSLVTYRIMLLVTAGLLVVTSHQGGSLTHGSDYLTKYAPDPLRRLLGLEVEEKVVVTRAEDLVVFEHLVRPIIEQNCQSCHNPEKLKGELNLATYAGHLAGGELGPALVPFDVEASEMIFRVTLPQDDEEFMPPDEKSPLSADEIGLLSWWIAQGALKDQKVGETAVIPDSVDAYIQTIFATMLTPAEREELNAARVRMYEELAEFRTVHGVLILPVEANATEFTLETNAVRKRFDDQLLAQLEPYGRSFVAADLSGAMITDDAMKSLAKFTRLRTLNLSQTMLSGKSIGKLAHLTELKSLNLYGAELTPAAIDELSKLTQLKKLFVFQTDLEADANLSRLRLALPDCEVFASGAE
jgi:uncharacterized membrane protein